MNRTSVVGTFESVQDAVAPYKAFLGGPGWSLTAYVISLVFLTLMAGVVIRMLNTSGYHKVALAFALVCFGASPWLITHVPKHIFPAFILKPSFFEQWGTVVMSLITVGSFVLAVKSYRLAVAQGEASPGLSFQKRPNSYQQGPDDADRLL